MTWTKGNSGNPTGKKPGTGHVQKIREGLEKALPEVMKTLVKQAKEGDTAAIKLILERTVPALRPTDTPTPIPLGDTPFTACKSIMAAVENGGLTPGQASTLLQGIGITARVEEVNNLKERLAALETAIRRT